MRKAAEFPIPRLSQRGTSYRIRWYQNKKLYDLTVGEISKPDAQRILAAIAAALANKYDWPPELLQMPIVKRYLADISGATIASDEDLINKYQQHQKTNGISNWHTTVKSHLLNASNTTGSLVHATPAILLDFLNGVADTTSKATRNRAFMSLSGFYRWLRLTGVHPKGFNPLAEIKQLREDPPPDGIVIWEPVEIRQLLKAANEFRDGIAVWIAIFAGLRRSEIARLEWAHISDTCIDVVISKTGMKRQVPLASRLVGKLKKTPKNAKKVVPWPDNFHGWETAATRLVKEYLPRELPALAEKHPEKFGWNAFRHTFASRHAQNGLSLDIISAWLGDSPKICKDHYARYVPINARDTRIDAVDIVQKPRKTHKNTEPTCKK